MTLFLRWTLVSLLLLLSGIPRPLHAEKNRDSLNGRPLYFSLIPKKDVDRQKEELQPLLHRVAEQLGRPIHFVRPHSYQSVIEGLLSHRVDFAILGPASYAYAKKRDPGIEAFASFSKKSCFFTPQGSHYYSILFTLKERNYATIKDLRGKTLALTDPASTSGSLIPRTHFVRHMNTTLEDFFKARVYTGSHDKSIRAVLKKQVDAAFVSSARLDEAVEKGELKVDEAVILWRSDPIHYDPFVFGSSMPDALRRKLRSIILSSSAEMKNILPGMGKQGLIPVSDDDYRPIHELVQD